MIFYLIALFFYIAAFAISFLWLAPLAQTLTYHALGYGWFGIFMGKVAWCAVMGLWLWVGVEAVRRVFWIGYGVSEDIGPGGEFKVWRFKSPWLSVTADFAAQTVRIHARKSSWRDAREGGDGKAGKGAVDITLPMSGLKHSIQDVKDTHLSVRRETAIATAPAIVSGQSIMVSTPVTVDVYGGESYQYSSGNQKLTFVWRDQVKRVERALTNTGLGGAMSGPILRVENTDRQVEISLILISRTIFKFADPWRKVADQMKALEEAREKALLGQAVTDR